MFGEAAEQTRTALCHFRGDQKDERWGLQSSPAFPSEPSCFLRPKCSGIASLMAGEENQAITEEPFLSLMFSAASFFILTGIQTTGFILLLTVTSLP